MSRIITSFVPSAEIIRRQKAFTKEDFAKTRLLYRILILIAFMAILSLFYIWSRVQIVHYGYEINKLQSRQSELYEINKKLNVEVATLKAPQRIEKVAREDLKMETPRPDQLQLIPSL